MFDYTELDNTALLSQSPPSILLPIRCLESMAITGTNPSLRIKHSLSKQHLRAARMFADRGRDLECRIGSEPGEPERVEHRAYVAACILSAVAFLESSINEFYLEAVDGGGEALKGLPPPTFALLAQFWLEIEQSAILHKYQTALLLGGVEKFERGAGLYQDAESAVKLRNALVHYKPEWDDEQGIHQNLERRLAGRFPVSPFASTGALWFPHVCLGSGCAHWLVETVSQFSNEFCSRLKIRSRVPAA